MINVSVDGRLIKTSARRKLNPRDLKVFDMVSADDDGNQVRGKLIFAKLVC